MCFAHAVNLLRFVVVTTFVQNHLENLDNRDESKRANTKPPNDLYKCDAYSQSIGIMVYGMNGPLQNIAMKNKKNGLNDIR